MPDIKEIQTALRAAPVGSAGKIEMQTKIAPFALGGQFRLLPTWQTGLCRPGRRVGGGRPSPTI